MKNENFFDYVSMLLKESGHMITSNAVYVNHTIKEALYIDSNIDVVITSSDRLLLSRISNISLIMEMKWPNEIDELDDRVQYFSITVDLSEKSRSQDVADIHFLLQKYWTNSFSVVFFKNDDKFVVLFADDTKSHILSDWFDLHEDYDKVIDRLSIYNFSLDECNEFFEDFVYAIARDYYIHPISFENASYGMVPIDFLSLKFPSVKNGDFDDEITKDDIKDMIQTNYSYYENLYGYDYVAVRYDGLDNETKYRNISNEIDRISFELDLAGESEEQTEINFDFDELFDEDDEEYFYDLDDDIDPEIFDDPVLMVKWLEKNQDIEENYNEQREFILHRRRVDQERRERECLEKDRLEAERRERERLEQERLEVERREQERLEQERLESERRERERLEQEHIEAEHRERERLVRELLDVLQKRLEEEYLKVERREQERLEQERLKAERREQERLEQERLEAERRERERLEQERLEAEHRERERLVRELLDVLQKRLEEEYLKVERREQERLEQERLEAERRGQERLEQERLEAERREQERLEQEQLEAERREYERLEKDKHDAILKNIHREYSKQVDNCKSEIDSVHVRLLEIEKRLSCLNIFQFIEKRNLNNEYEKLIIRKNDLEKKLVDISREYENTIDGEEKRFSLVLLNSNYP